MGRDKGKKGNEGKEGGGRVNTQGRKGGKVRGREGIKRTRDSREGQRRWWAVEGEWQLQNNTGKYIIKEE